MYVEERTTRSPKIMMFAKAKKPYFRDAWVKIAKILGVDQSQAKKEQHSQGKRLPSWCVKALTSLCDGSVRRWRSSHVQVGTF